jgi:replication factor C large subunit
LWIEENVPLEYRNPADLERAFYYIARTDLMLGRAQRRQLFGLWRYATDLMGAGVAVSKSARVQGYQRYSFPMWLLRMGRSKAVRRQRAETYGKLGAYFHTSRREVGASLMPYLPRLMEADFELAVHVSAGADLEPEDLAEVLGRDADSPEVKAIRERARALLESGASLGAAAEARRGGGRGMLSLGEAAQMAKEQEQATKKAAKEGAKEGAKRKGKGKKAEGEEAEAPPPDAQEPPAPEADDAKDDPDEDGAQPEAGGPPQKSLFEF